jgi:hypothetical protein
MVGCPSCGGSECVGLGLRGDRGPADPYCYRCGLSGEAWIEAARSAVVRAGGRWPFPAVDLAAHAALRPDLDAFWNRDGGPGRREGAGAVSAPENAPERRAGPADGSLADLLATVSVFVRRFVVMTDHQTVAVALWAAHTHAQDAAQATPYLAVMSPVKRSGKSRLLEALTLIVARPLSTAGASVAVLFRSIDDGGRTLLLDEVDAIFTRRRGEQAEGAEGLRGLLNAGHRRGATFDRMVGQGSGMKPRSFAVFCPKALAGIGRLPDTVLDRSIPITLKRRRRAEAVERFRPTRLRREADRIRTSLAEWATAAAALADADPALPDALNDRAQDGWEPLLAIADLAGGDWPTRARRAAAALSGDPEHNDDESLGVRLLADIRTAFGDDERLFSKGLVARLVADEEGPWGDLHGRELDARSLARLLAAFDIRPRSIRIGEATAKGYERGQFTDAFERYCTPPETPPDALGDIANVTPSQPSPQVGSGRDGWGLGEGRPSRSDPSPQAGCDGVTFNLPSQRSGPISDSRSDPPPTPSIAGLREDPDPEPPRRHGDPPDPEESP